MQAVGRKQVDNKITSKTQIVGGCEFRVKEEVTQTGRKNTLIIKKFQKLS